MALLLTYLAGLAVAFTPCVYPLIPITLGVLVQPNAQGKQGSAFFRSLAFVLGLSIVYAVLGTAAASSGLLMGTFTQRPVVAWAVAGIFALMGLSLLGLIPFRIPSSWSTWLAARSGKGIFGPFVIGAVSGLLAAPCSGPVAVGVLTAVARDATPWRGFLQLWIYGMGIGTPFLILGTFSQLLARMPRSGAWTEWVKRFCGVALLVAAVWFVWPFIGTRSSVVSAPDPAKAGELIWLTNEREGLKRAFAEQKPVLLDFWATWCDSCGELDEKVFTDSSVKASLAREFVLIRIDATDIEAPEIQKLARKYGVVSLPTILFLEPTGKIMKGQTVAGFVEAEEFLKTLDAVRKSVRPIKSL